MKFDIKISKTRIDAIFKSFSYDLEKKLNKALFEAAMEGRRMILDRTKRGIDLTGKFFKGYTSEYANFRRKRGRSLKPNLRFTGEMLGSITVIRRKGYAVIKFSRFAEAIKAAGNNEKRPFFGLNNDEKKELTRFVRGRL